MRPDEDLRIIEIEQQVERVTDVLRSLLSWMGQSPTCPLSRREVESLLRVLEDAE